MCKNCSAMYSKWLITPLELKKKRNNNNSNQKKDIER